MQTILNIAAYKFVSLNQPARWRESIRSQAAALELKGTVLLAKEGLNLVLAGAVGPVREFVGWLRADPRFADLDIK